MHNERLWQLVSKKLANEATAEELTELEELLRLHPEMHYAIQHVQDLWKLQPLPAPEASEAFRKHLEKMKEQGVDISAWPAPDPRQPQPDPPKKFARRYLLAALSMAAIATCIILMYRQTGADEKPSLAQNVNEIITRNGSRTRINLPDGSTVWLNAGSKLTYNKTFGSADRNVELTGEAFFDVARQEKLPFVIHTPAMKVKVLGTVFNVKSYPDERSSETSVIKGSVEIIPLQRPGEKYVLQPNEKIVVLNKPASADIQSPQAAQVTLSTLTYFPTDSAVVETSWVENKLAFDNESFADVALKMERWYGVKIEFRNAELEQMRLTGSFVNETIYEALNALQVSEGFSYKVEDEKIIIMK